MSKGIVLALGGGGARGFAHIGVIEELEKAGFTIRAITGTSIGAMIGGIYSTGTLKQFAEAAFRMNNKTLRNFVDLTISPKGLMKGEKIFDFIAEEVTPDCKIEDLPIPFTSIATDLQSGETVLLREGSLFEAIRASIAIPNLFTPVIKDRMKLVDGGITCPLPVQYIQRILPDDLIVAVNLNGKTRLYPDDETIDNSNEPGWLKIFTRLPEKLKPEFQFDYVLQAQRSIELMQAELSKLSIECYPPDLVIEIPHQVAHLVEFNHAAEIYEFGRYTAQKALQKLTLR